jgi:hypothetical protein
MLEKDCDSGRSGFDDIHKEIIRVKKLLTTAKTPIKTEKIDEKIPDRKVII